MISREEYEVAQRFLDEIVFITEENEAKVLEAARIVREYREQVLQKAS